MLLVIDGYNGTFGKTLIQSIRETNFKIEVCAAGTNEIATARMLKAGADKAATGLAAINKWLKTARTVVGPLSIIIPYGLMGEVSPQIATAISASNCSKILIPLTEENIIVAGFNPEPLPHLIEKVIKRLNAKLG